MNLSREGKLTSRSQSIAPNSPRHKIRRKHLHQMRGARLTRTVGKSRHPIAIPPRDTARRDDLTLHIRPHIAPRIARIQQLQKGQHREVDARDVDRQRLGEVLHRVVERLGHEVRQRQVRPRDVPRRPADPGVGHQQVDVAGLGLDLARDGVERGFGRDVADERDDVAVRGLGGGGVEDVFASPDDVDFGGAVGFERFGDHETDA